MPWCKADIVGPSSCMIPIFHSYYIKQASAEIATGGASHNRTKSSTFVPASFAASDVPTGHNRTPTPPTVSARIPSCYFICSALISYVSNFLNLCAKQLLAIARPNSCMM